MYKHNQGITILLQLLSIAAHVPDVDFGKCSSLNFLNNTMWVPAVVLYFLWTRICINLQ